MAALKVWNGSAWVTVGPQPAGVPAGGTINQVLRKASAANYDTTWASTSLGNSTSVAGPPTSGTWARGDEWLDANNVTWVCVTAGTPGAWVPPIGYEYAYAQMTATLNVTATLETSAQTAISVTATFDGSPILLEFFCVQVATPNVAGGYVNTSLWDGGTDLGLWGSTYSGSAAGMAATLCARRRLTPTAGSHTYSARAHIGPSGTGQLAAGAGGPSSYGPSFLRIIRV